MAAVAHTRHGPAALYAWASGLVLSTIIHGMRQAYGDSGSLLDLLLPFAFIPSVVMICVEDARLRSRRIPLTLRGTMFLLWPVAVPVYAYWVGRWRGLAAVAALCVGLFVLTTLAYHVFGIALYGPAWLAAAGAA